MGLNPAFTMFSLHVIEIELTSSPDKDDSLAWSIDDQIQVIPVRMVLDDIPWFRQVHDCIAPHCHIANLAVPHSKLSAASEYLIGSPKWMAADHVDSMDRCVQNSIRFSMRRAEGGSLVWCYIRQLIVELSEVGLCLI